MNNKLEWWRFAKENEEKLTSLIFQFHPSEKKGHDLKITAKMPEKARLTVVDELQKQYEKTLVLQDYVKFCFETLDDALFHILEDTWFGVPESTECWQLEGFIELCQLLESDAFHNGETSDNAREILAILKKYFDYDDFHNSLFQVLIESNFTEYRFQGNLGFGGKLWLSHNSPPKYCVTNYPEHMTQSKELAIKEANERLKKYGQE